jgi:hypothetical protein
MNTKCPVCYGEMKKTKCSECELELTELELIQLKADTYDDIINHLSTAAKDCRRREKARTRIAMRTIRRWAELNKEVLAYCRGLAE